MSLRVFRSHTQSTRRLLCSLSNNASARRRPQTWRSSSIWPCASAYSAVDPSRLLSSSCYSTSSPMTIRPLHYASRPPISSSEFSNNLIPLYNTSLCTRLSPRRIGLRFMNSNSSNKPPSSTESGDSTTPSPSNPSETSGPLPGSSSSSSPGDKVPKASENPSLRGLRDSMDTTIKEVRSKVNPRDLLYYFALLAVFALLVVGPFAAQHMRRSDTDYDELDSEDPINDLATFVRTELLQEGIDENQSGEAGSKMGGLDTLIADLLRSPHIQDAINELINKILNSPQFKRSCSILLKELWKDLVDDPETLKQVIHLLYNSIQDEAIKDAAVQLVTEVFADKEVLDEVVDLFQRLGQEPKVQVATQELLVESAHNALNDPEILDHSMEFATDVVGDDVVQQTAGEALYNTLSYAVRPTLSVFLAVLGTGLIFMSLVAFQHFIAPESQSQSLDRALDSFEKSGLVEGVIQFITFSWKALVACKDAVAWLFLLPVRLFSGTLTGLGRMGNATVDTLNRCIRWLLNLPIHLAQTLLGAMGKGITSLSDGLARQSRQLGRTMSGSFLGVFFHRLADGFVTTTRGLQHAWVVSNQVAEDGAIAIETLGYKTLQVLEKGATQVIAGWAATQSTFVSTYKTIRRGWVSTNRVVGNAALDLEFYSKVSFSRVMTETQRIERSAASVGMTKNALSHAFWQTKVSVISGYHWLNRGAGRLGIFLEDQLHKVATKLQDLQGRNRPAL